MYVSFEGVATRADVYVNGRHLGRHLGAYTAFTFDATPAVVPGTNVVAVRVSNHPQDTIDSLPSGAGKQLYRTYGGIYRKAWLLTTRSAHFADTRRPSAVEVPGIEPGSSVALSRLLRAQFALSLLGPTDHAN